MKTPKHIKSSKNKSAASYAYEIIEPALKKKYETNVRIMEMNAARKEKAERKTLKKLSKENAKNLEKTGKTNVQKHKTKRDRFKVKKLSLFKISKMLYLAQEASKKYKQAKRHIASINAKEQEEIKSPEGNVKVKEKVYDPNTQSFVTV